MASLFVLLVYLAFYLWYVFLPVGGIITFLGWKWWIAAASLGGKMGSIILLAIGIPMAISGIYGFFIKHF